MTHADATFEPDGERAVRLTTAGTAVMPGSLDTALCANPVRGSASSRAPPPRRMPLPSATSPAGPACATSAVPRPASAAPTTTAPADQETPMTESSSTENAQCTPIPQGRLVLRAFATLAGAPHLAAAAFEPLTTDGRHGVSVHFLYSNRDTDSDGSAAALVRYEPGALTPRHQHGGDEIVLVLEGELITEAGRHPAGDLLVMPTGSLHSPRSDTGALTLVVWDKPVHPA